MIQRPVGDHGELHFLPPPHRASLRGILRRTAPQEAWTQAREEAWRKALEEEA